MREKLFQQIHQFFRTYPGIEVTFANIKHLVEKDKSFASSSAARKWFSKHKAKFLESSLVDKSKIEDTKFVQYNKEADQYAFFPEQDSGLVGTFVISGDKIRSIIRNYSNVTGKSETTTKISQAFGIPRRAVVHILKSLNIKHDSLPFSNEEMAEKSDEELITDYVEQRNFQVGQKIARKNYELIKKDSESWNSFKAGVLDPFETALKDFKAKDIPLKPIRIKEKSFGKNVFVVTLSDLHIGDWYSSAFSGTEYNCDIAAAKLDDYFAKIALKVLPRAKEFSHCECFIMGDILNSCLSGKTFKGTELRNDIINEQLFDFGLDVILRFIKRLEDLFVKVQVNCTVGNHDSALVHCLYRACEKFFSSNKNINFFISKEFISHRMINNALFMFSHGGFDKFKANVPNKEGLQMDGFVHTFMIDRPDLLSHRKGRYIFVGHTHSFKNIERNHFEFFVVSAPVPSTEHSTNLSFRNKSRGQCFVVGESGYIEEVLHIHLN